MEDYRKLYRFDEINIEWLALHFLGENWDKRGGGLSPKQQMQTFLRYMADPGFQNGVGEDVGVDQSTVSKTVHKAGYISTSNLYSKLSKIIFCLSFR